MSTYSNAVSYQMTGFPELQRALRALGPALKRRAYTTATRKAATYLNRVAKLAAPKQVNRKSYPSVLRRLAKLGKLRQNIHVARLTRGMPPDSVGFRVTTGKAFWGYILEKGGRNQPRRPWFDRAIGPQMDNAFGAMRRELTRFILQESARLYLDAAA